MLITLVRLPAQPLWTDGFLLVDGNWFGYALEDRKLFEGKENVSRVCCILKGEYKVVVTPSGTFGRKMPLILDTPNRRGIRFHGGNTEKDIKGCIIAASRKLGPGHVQGSLEATLTHRIELAGAATLRILEAA
jgi:hypothetical protein